MTSAPTRRLTEAEYIALDDAAERKSEFVRGEMFEMAGASPMHNLITTNIAAALQAIVRERPCVVLSSDQRIHVEATGLYSYSDGVVVCGPLARHPRFRDTLLNPSIVFEVLSPSTEAYDRGDKFFQYRTLASLREYVLVSQSRPLVEHFERVGESWHLSTWAAPSTHVPLPSLRDRSSPTFAALALSEVYAKAELLEPLWPDLPRPKALR
jgi:Uma2 family endonuclease